MKRREDLIGRPLFSAFPLNPDDPMATGAPNIRHSLDTVLRTDAPHTIAAQRYDIPGPGGKFERHYWRLVSSPIHDPRGRIAHVLHHVEDVTPYQMLAAERTRAVSEREEHARLEAAALGRAEEAERRLLTVLDQTPLGILIADAPSGRLLFANTRAVEIFGPAALRTTITCTPRTGPLFTPAAGRSSPRSGPWHERSSEARRSRARSSG